MTDGGRTERLRGLLWIALALAIVPNTVNSFDAAPEGDWWDVLRFCLSTLFVIALVAFAASRLADRRG